MLRDFYYSDDRRLDSAVLALEEAASMTVSVGGLKGCERKGDEGVCCIGSGCEDRVCEVVAKVFFGGQGSWV